MSNQNNHEDSYRLGGQGFSGVPGGVVVDAGSGGFGGQKYAKQGQQAGTQEHTQPAHDDGAYRYGGQGFSGVPGGVVVDAGSGGFGGQKYAQQAQQGQQSVQQPKPTAHDDEGYRYGGQGFSGVPGGVAIEAGSGGFGGERYATPPVGGAASDGASHHHSHHHGSGGAGAQGAVAPGTGHAHHKHEHHDEERR